MTETRPDAGFTLIEMLVAIALLSLIAAYGVATLRTLGRARDIEAGMNRNNEIAATRGHLRHTLADTRIVFETTDRDGTALVFLGNADSIVAVAPLDDRTVRGGLYRLDYHLVGSALVLDYALLRDGDKTLANDRVALLDDVKSLVIEYFGDPDLTGTIKWNKTWPAKDRLPSRVRIALALAKGSADSWPPLEITLNNTN